MKNEYKYPVRCIGNKDNPKLIILLYNPYGDTNFYKRFPEYAMDKDGQYSESDMTFNQVIQYDAWWGNFIQKINSSGIKDNEILALEYYPYHTCNSSDVPRNWDDYAKQALEDNKKLLMNFINDKKVFICVYYKADWLDICPDLNKPRENILITKNGWPNSKQPEIISWLNKTLPCANCEQGGVLEKVKCQVAE
ncbi:MAG: hypothetical protein LBU68_00905 [Rickettsiales bacterium]|jgi:hypothetical protein|nr:hypothetical protein [Rickettsiales bacterium]